MPAFSLRSLRFFEQPCLQKEWRHLEKLLRVSMAGDEISLRNITGLNLPVRRRQDHRLGDPLCRREVPPEKEKMVLCSQGPARDRDDHALPRRAMSPTSLRIQRVAGSALPVRVAVVRPIRGNEGAGAVRSIALRRWHWLGRESHG
jgi:hypothetical protein